MPKLQWILFQMIVSCLLCYFNSILSFSLLLITNPLISKNNIMIYNTIFFNERVFYVYWYFSKIIPLCKKRLPTPMIELALSECETFYLLHMYLGLADSVCILHIQRYYFNNILRLLFTTKYLLSFFNLLSQYGA